MFLLAWYLSLQKLTINLKNRWETLGFLRIFFKNVDHKYLWFKCQVFLVRLPCLCETAFHTTAYLMINIIKVPYEKQKQSIFKESSNLNNFTRLVIKSSNAMILSLKMIKTFNLKNNLKVVNQWESEFYPVFSRWIFHMTKFLFRFVDTWEINALRKIFSFPAV